jgi:hypothetical protein
MMEEIKVPQFGKKTLVVVQPAVPLTDEQIVGMILIDPFAQEELLAYIKGK